VAIIQENYAEFEKFRLAGKSPFIDAIVFAIPIFLTLWLILARGSNLMYSVLCLLLTLTIYPSAILVSKVNVNPLVFILNLFYFFALYFIGNFLHLRLALPQINERYKTSYLFFLSVAFITPFVVLYLPYIDFNNLLLANIYESRDVERAISNLYTDYLYSPLSNVMIPMLLILAFIHREYIKAPVAIALLLFMFLVGGHKSVFFATFLIICFYFGDYHQKIKYFLLGTTIVVLAAIVSFKVWDNFFLTSLFTRRIFFLPAILDIGYFDFFRDKPLFWSGSIFKFFIDYPYEVSPPFLIGNHVLVRPLSHANSGIISDGYMQLGIPGAVLNIVLVSIVFAVVNSLRISHHFFGTVFLLFFTFSSSYFFTAMITHGWLLFLILAHFFLKDTEIKYHE
jgi:hypothetical protein